MAQRARDDAARRPRSTRPMVTGSSLASSSGKSSGWSPIGWRAGAGATGARRSADVLAHADAQAVSSLGRGARTWYVTEPAYPPSPAFS
jgi:hypothetical protein